VVDVTWTRRLLEAFFAVVSVVFGHVLFGETVPSSTWLGLSVILAGSAVVQFGAPR
jgi:drug/metabolite transporter (DMT)-like permease